MKKILLFLPGWLLLAVPAARAQFEYTTNNGALTISGYTGPGGAVTIPAIIPPTTNGLPVTSIGAGAFYNLVSLTSVAIPASVITIGDYAFENCYNLASIAIGSGVTSIGDSVFASSKLAEVTIPNNVTSIGEGVFYSCTSLTNVTIGSGIISIGNDEFERCVSLASVTIGSGIAGIGSDAFADCTSLTNVYFQGNAPNVDSTVFQFDPAVTVYYLPGTTGWGSELANFPTAPWALPYPLILTTSPGFGFQTNQFGFNISWATNRTVVVEACADLTHPVWQPVQTNTLTGGTCFFSDPQWTNYPSRFYRISSP